MNNAADGSSSSTTTSKPVCMGVGATRNVLKLVPCFHDDVPPTLAQGWETGAMILEETLLQHRCQLGTCSTDGNFVRLENGAMHKTGGKYIPKGQRCHLTQMDVICVG
jgi:hypothetical protein